jgi:hypothetical protein
MRRLRASEGLGLILIFLILFALAVFFGLILVSYFGGRSTLTVENAFWTVDNQTVSTSALGQQVEAHVVIEATEKFVGSVVVKIRKDVAQWVDSDFQVSTITLDLRGGEEKEIEISFTPDQVSSGGFLGMRGYFVEVEYRANRNGWVMEDSYPPRLKVTD